MWIPPLCGGGVNGEEWPVFMKGLLSRLITFSPDLPQFCKTLKPKLRIFRFVAPEFKDLTGRKQAACLKMAPLPSPVGGLWLRGLRGGNNYVACHRGKKTLGCNLSTCNAERCAW